MAKHDRRLRVLLRAMGTAELLAIPCILLPCSWMNEIHQGLGMGTLPDTPMVGYLARSTTAFYALLGGLLWILSFDIPRHRPVVGYVGGAMVTFGLVILAADLFGGMPVWWSLGDFLVKTGFGGAVLALCLITGRQNPQ